MIDIVYGNGRPPANDSIALHGRLLAAALVEEGHPARSLTLPEARSDHELDGRRVVLQYNPYSYGSRAGVAPHLAAWSRELANETSVDLFAVYVHEPWIP